MLSLISAMCHKLQQQSIQPFWPHPTCCHTEKNETVGEIFAEQRLSFVKTYVAKKVCFYFYGSWERGKWRNIACLHSCAGIRWFQTSETCQHHKLIKITNLSTSQTCQHHNFVNITILSTSQTYPTPHTTCQQNRPNLRLVVAIKSAFLCWQQWQEDIACWFVFVNLLWQGTFHHLLQKDPGHLFKFKKSLFGCWCRW